MRLCYSDLAAYAERRWYGERPPGWLLPLAYLYQTVSVARRRLYRAGWLASERLPVPVVVVGNISVGGVGKTPLAIWLVETLRAAGYRPGVVSRGYGGRPGQGPQRVGPDSDPALVGDEPLLIARRAACPVAVAPRRAEAAALLLDECDVLVADDGLQHYALARDVEIAVLDGLRRHGNGACLPAGPLREPVSRLAEVDLLVCNGGQIQSGEYAMALLGDTAVNLADGRRRPLAEFSGPVHALAGIGHPQRFFAHLRQAGLALDERPLPDHHAFTQADLEFGDDLPVLMTEKDAVKCTALADARHWAVPVQARLDPAFGPRLLQLLQENYRGRETA
jgi:tetraacyldisaccharide 4'-kinase